MSLAAPFRPARISSAGRSAVVAAMAFFTVVDLFATQAILPMLAAAYGVAPSAMGMAVNACTLGMAVAGLATALFSRRIDRRNGVVASLVLLAVPTALLALAPDLTSFAVLRIAQGLCMSTAFALTLAWLGERGGMGQASAFAAYITGNVASNLVGRLVAATVTDGFGLAGNFAFFAALNLAGAALAWAAMRERRRRHPGRRFRWRAVSASFPRCRCYPGSRSASASCSPSSASLPTSTSCWSGRHLVWA